MVIKPKKIRNLYVLKRDILAMIHTTSDVAYANMEANTKVPSIEIGFRPLYEYRYRLTRVLAVSDQTFGVHGFESQKKYCKRLEK